MGEWGSKDSQGTQLAGPPKRAPRRLANFLACASVSTARWQPCARVLAVVVARREQAACRSFDERVVVVSVDGQDEKSTYQGRGTQTRRDRDRDGTTATNRAKKKSRFSHLARGAFPHSLPRLARLHKGALAMTLEMEETHCRAKDYSAETKTKGGKGKPGAEPGRLMHIN